MMISASSEVVEMGLGSGGPVRALRRRLGWSQAKLAAFCRMRSTATISALETGALDELPSRISAGLCRLGVDVDSVGMEQRCFAADTRQSATASAHAVLRPTTADDAARHRG
jgi:transcriptional regulator with XRE-family HTH domain